MKNTWAEERGRQPRGSGWALMVRSSNRIHHVKIAFSWHPPPSIPLPPPPDLLDPLLDHSLTSSTSSTFSSTTLLLPHLSPSRSRLLLPLNRTRWVHAWLDSPSTIVSHPILLLSAKQAHLAVNLPIRVFGQVLPSVTHPSHHKTHYPRASRLSYTAFTTLEALV
jgi:hypothetical protein